MRLPSLLVGTGLWSPTFEYLSDDGLRALVGRSALLYSPRYSCASRAARGAAAAHGAGLFQGATAGSLLRFTVRLTRVSDTTDEPTTFTRPFVVALPMRRAAVPIPGCACHEPNDAMPNRPADALVAEMSAR